MKDIEKTDIEENLDHDQHQAPLHHQDPGLAAHTDGQDLVHLRLGPGKMLWFEKCVLILF